MIRLEHLVRAYKNNGYTELTTKYFCLNILWKGGNTQKVIAIIDNTDAYLFTKAGTVHFKEWLKNESILKTEADMQVLFIVKDYDNNNLRPKYITDNVIYINEKNLHERKGSINSVFEEELSVYRKFYKETKAKAKWLSLHYGYVTKEYDAWFTYIMIIACVFISFKTLFASTVAGLYGISAETVFGNAQYYRLISYQFLHSNLGHLLGNMITLYIYGKALEQKSGFIKTSTIYMLGGIYAGLYSLIASIYLTGAISQITIGASGAIYAVLGAYIAYVLLDNNRTAKTIKTTIIYVLIGLVSGFFQTGVDAFCHLGGLLMGFVAMVCYVWADESKSNLEYTKITRKMLSKDKKIPVLRR